MSATCKRLVCIDESDAIDFLLGDEERFSLHNESYNCDGNSTLYFGDHFFSFDYLEKLMSKKLIKIRVNSYSSSEDYSFTESQQVKIRDGLKCLLRN